MAAAPLHEAEDMSPLGDDEEQLEKDQDEEYFGGSPADNIVQESGDLIQSAYIQAAEKEEKKEEMHIVVVPPEPKRLKTKEYKPPASKPIPFIHQQQQPVEQELLEKGMTEDLRKAPFKEALHCNRNLGQLRRKHREYFSFDKMKNNYILTQDGRSFHRPPLHQNHNSFLHSNYQPGLTFVNAMNHLTQVSKEHRAAAKDATSGSKKLPENSKVSMDLGKRGGGGGYLQSKLDSKAAMMEKASYEQHQRQIETLAYFTQGMQRKSSQNVRYNGGPNGYPYQRPPYPGQYGGYPGNYGGQYQPNQMQQNPYYPNPSDQQYPMFAVQQMRTAQPGYPAAQDGHFLDGVKEEPTGQDEFKQQHENLDDHAAEGRDNQSHSPSKKSHMAKQEQGMLNSHNNSDSPSKANEDFERGESQHMPILGAVLDSSQLMQGNLELQPQHSMHHARSASSYGGGGGNVQMSQGRMMQLGPHSGDFMCVTCGRGPPHTKKYAKNQCQTCYKKNKKRIEGPPSLHGGYGGNPQYHHPPHYSSSNLGVTGNMEMDYYTMSQGTFNPSYQHHANHMLHQQQQQQLRMHQRSQMHQQQQHMLPLQQREGRSSIASSEERHGDNKKNNNHQSNNVSREGNNNHENVEDNPEIKPQ